MNSVQRMWLVGSLVAIGVALAVTAFEWRDDGGIGITFYTVSPPPSPPAPASNFIPPELRRVTPINTWDLGATKEYGIYVRRRWGAAAVAWGGFLPLCLFAVAGFVALGGRADRQHLI